MIPRLSYSGAAICCALVAALIVLAQLGGDDWQRAWRWDRSALEEFAWWRLWTGHLVHASWPHVGMNLLGLALVAWLFPEPASAWRQGLRMLWLAVFTSVAIYVWVPTLHWYVGLSGVLHGSFVFGLWWLWRQGDGLAALILVLLGGKLILEHWIGPITSDEELVGVPVLTEAHSFGALGAVIWIGCAQGLARLRRHAHNAPP